MKRVHRAICALVAALTLNLFVSPCFAADGLPSGPEKKITVNDPQFVPLSEPKSLQEGGKLKWYWYVIGAALIGGGIAVAAAGSKDNGTSAPTTGGVSGSW